MEKVYDEFDFIGDIKLMSNQNLRQRKGLDNNSLIDGLKFMLTGNGNNKQFIDIGAFMNKDGTADFHQLSWSDDSKIVRTKRPFADRLKQDVINGTPHFAKIIVDTETDFDLKEEYMQLFYKGLSQRVKDATPEQIEKGDKYMAEYQEMAINRKEFLHMFDVVEYLEKIIPEVAGKYKMHITGNVNPNLYKGKTSLRYDIKKIELLPLDTPSQFIINTHLFFEPKALDFSRESTDGVIDVDGYIQGYCKVSKEDRLFPQQFVIQNPKISLTGEEQEVVDNLSEQDSNTLDTMTNLDIIHPVTKKKMNEVSSEAYNSLQEAIFLNIGEDGFNSIVKKCKLNKMIENKVSYMKSIFEDVKRREVMCLPFKVFAFNGSEEAEVEWEDLTPAQQKSVLAGIVPIEKYADKKVYENKVEMRLIEPLLKDKFSEGAIEVGIKSNEIMDFMVLDNSDGKLDKPKTVVQEAEKETVEPEVAEIPVQDTQLNSELDKLMEGLSL